jgi:hypothetical protein
MEAPVKGRVSSVTDSTDMVRMCWIHSDATAAALMKGYTDNYKQS